MLAESCGEILDVSAMRYVVMQFLALRIDDGSSAEDAVAGLEHSDLASAPQHKRRVNSCTADPLRPCEFMASQQLGRSCAALREGCRHSDRYRAF
jgi:hypothetical protein